MTLLALVIGIALLLYVLAGGWTHRERTRLGLGDGAIIAADDSRLGAPTLFSARLGLVGRPDHLLRAGPAVIPVEQKPRARRVQPSYVMQLAVQCVLVEDIYGSRPPYGLLVLADGVQHRVPFTLARERSVFETVTEMRELLLRKVEPGPQWVGPKCRACGFRTTCWE
jgi:CRISPR-associated exonuclease Cas4